MKRVKHHNVFVYYSKYKSSSVTLTRYLLKNWFWRYFSSLVLGRDKIFFKIYIIPPLELTLNYIVLKYSLLDTTCFTYAEDNFISPPACVIEEWLLQTSLHIWTHNVKKICQHPRFEEHSVKLTYMIELLSRYQCNESKTIPKGSSTPNLTKNGQQSSRIKSFGPTNQSSKSFSQIRGSVYDEGLAKELLPLTMEEALLWCRGLLPLAKLGICPKWRANWIRPAITVYCSITRSYLVSQWFVLITQSILVNSAKVT